MKTTTRKTKYALISGSLNRLGGLKKLWFIPGDFSKASFWSKKTSAKAVFDHFRSNPGKPCRVKGSLAKEVFGFTDRELWHDIGAAG